MELIIGIFWKLLWPVLAVLGVIAAAWGYGQKKKAEGRAQEQARAEKVVRKVDAEMKAEVDKPRTPTKTKDRLGKGTF